MIPSTPNIVQVMKDGGVFRTSLANGRGRIISAHRINNTGCVVAAERGDQVFELGPDGFGRAVAANPTALEADELPQASGNNRGTRDRE